MFCYFYFIFIFFQNELFEKKLGLEQEKDSALIIIALPEGSIQWTNSNDAETQQIPIKTNTDMNKAFAVCFVRNRTKEWLKLLVKGESVTHLPQSRANFGYLISDLRISVNNFTVLIFPSEI